MTFHVALVVKNLPDNAGDLRDAGSVPRLGRSPGGGHGNPLRCSCLENPMDRRACRATVYRVAKSRTRLSALDTWVSLNCTRFRECNDSIHNHNTQLSCVQSHFSHVWLFVTPWTQPTRLLRPWNSPGKNTGMGCHFLLWRIFPTQGLNLWLLHCRWSLYRWATREVHYDIQRSALLKPSVFF